MKETLKKFFNKNTMPYIAIGIAIILAIATPWNYTKEEYDEAVDESFDLGHSIGWDEGYEDAKKYYSNLDNDYNNGYKQGYIDALFDHIDEVDEKSFDVTCPDCGNTFSVWNDDGTVVAPPKE